MADNEDQQNKSFNLWGWLFKRKETTLEEPPSFAPREQDDGSVVVTATGAFGTYVDLDGTIRTEAELISRYRDMSIHPECDSAIDEIVNESISTDEDKVVRIKLDLLDFPDKVKKSIEGCFDDICKLLDFQNHAYDIMRRWYIDGRLYFHTIIDNDNTKDGIKEIRYIDPRKIRKIREVIKKRVPGGTGMGTEAVISQTKNEYYLYNDKGFNIGNKPVGPSTTGLKIARDSICYVTSGLTDTAGTMVLSFMHKAIKPLNQLRTLEDAVVINRISRAPMRRVWYIDVGNLPKIKAEQYVRDVMVKQKNRLVYDASTGSILDDRRFMTMLEDYYLPRREGQKGTEVTNLPGLDNPGALEDVLYFQKRLYVSLHVPVNRLDPNNQYNIGVATEITRDEIKFGKFIARIRNRFGQLFIKLLEKQITLKNIMTIEDWQKIVPFVRFDFAHDNYFVELKNSQIYENRANLANLFIPFLNKYISNEWLRKNILQQTDEDIDSLDEQIMDELQDPFYNPPPSMDEEQPEEEEEEGSPQSSGVVVDQGAVSGPPGIQNQPEKVGGGKPAKKAKKKNVDFREMSKKLKKGT
jgi:hypothetical protein